MPSAKEIEAGAKAMAREEARVYSLGDTPDEWASRYWHGYAPRAELVMRAAEKIRADQQKLES